MPCQITHLAIAKRYMEKHAGIKKPRDFYDGNVLPDLAKGKDKEKSHYGNRSEQFDLRKRHREKVNPNKFLEENKLDSDMNRGIYLHLLTDYEFYCNFADFGFEELKDFYYTTRYYREYIKDKYGVSLALTSYQQEFTDMWNVWVKHDDERWGGNYVGKLIFTLEELDDFIERITAKPL